VKSVPRASRTLGQATLWPYRLAMITPVRSALISPSLYLAYQRVGLAVFRSRPIGVAISATALTAAVVSRRWGRPAVRPRGKEPHMSMLGGGSARCWGWAWECRRRGDDLDGRRDKRPDGLAALDFSNASWLSESRKTSSPSGRKS